MASVIVLLVEALVLVLLLVGALLWLFFLRQPRPRCSGPDLTTRGRAEVRGFPRSLLCRKQGFREGPHSVTG